MHIARFREKVEEEEKKMENSWDKHVFAERYQPPNNKDCTKAADLQPGDYIAYGFSEILFRNSWRTILYLLPADAEGNPTTNVGTPVYGHFLQKELDALSDLENQEQPIRCRFGKEKTTSCKHKDRVVWIA